jgi:hypothetical protein
MTSLRDSTADAAAALMTGPEPGVGPDGSVTLTRDQDIDARRFICEARATLGEALNAARNNHDRRVLRDRINGLNSVLAMLGRD